MHALTPSCHIPELVEHDNETVTSAPEQELSRPSHNIPALCSTMATDDDTGTASLLSSKPRPASRSWIAEYLYLVRDRRAFEFVWHVP